MQKHNIMRLLSILLTLCIVLVSAPLVHAAPATSVNVGGETLNADFPYLVAGVASASGTLGSDGCTAHFADGVLTLHDYSGGGITAGSGVIEIVLMGENVATDDRDSGNAFGIYSNGSVIISGTGELEITATATSAGSSGGGIYAAGGVTIKGGTLDITATSVAAGSYGYGIHAFNGDVVIEGGDVTIDAEGDESYGIRAYNGDVAIEGGDITITANSTGEFRAGYGIHALVGDVVIEGGDITIAATARDADSFGIRASGTIDISGGTLAITTISTDGSGASYGLHSSDDITVGGDAHVTIDASAGGETEVSYGIFVTGSAAVIISTTERLVITTNNQAIVLEPTVDEDDYDITGAWDEADVSYIYKTSGEQEDSEYTFVQTIEVFDITATTATVKGEVFQTDGPIILSVPLFQTFGNGDPIQRGFIWGTSEILNMSSYDGITAEGFTDMDDAVGEYLFLIEGLSPGADYYVRAFFAEDEEISYGRILEFTTLSSPSSTGPDDEPVKLPKTGGGAGFGTAGMFMIALGGCLMILRRKMTKHGA